MTTPGNSGIPHALFTSLSIKNETSWAIFQNATRKDEVSHSLHPHLSNRDELAFSPTRRGEVAVYHRQFNAGVRYPLDGCVVEMLKHFELCPAQITPNAWGMWVGFIMLCYMKEVPYSLSLFRLSVKEY